MPPRGAAVRAEQLATLGRIAHQKFTSPEIGRLLDELAPFEQEHEYDSFEASLVRVVRRDWEKARKVPTELRAEMSRVGVARRCRSGSRRARTTTSPSFLPALRTNLELRKRYIECFDGDYAEPYDAVLDDYERGMTDRRGAGALRLPEGAPGAARQAGRRRAAQVPRPAARRRSRSSRQKQFELEVVRRFGFDDEAWRLDPTVHPFAIGRRHAGHPHHDALLRGQPRRPVRDDARDRPRPLRAPGRPLARADAARARRLARAARVAEPDVGEPRRPLAAVLELSSFRGCRSSIPTRSPATTPSAWYREINAVEPSLIRVEADEATYNLHIILRFELEQELLAEAFPLEQLPEEWNRRVWEYLGIEVPDDTHGVLQDTHWSSGSIGYFPTYALGNLISAQLWERVLADLPGLHDDFERGEFGALREWLRERLHRHGRKFTPMETLERAIGTDRIDPEPYVRYLREKVGAIYGLPAPADRVTVLPAALGAV